MKRAPTRSGRPGWRAWARVLLASLSSGWRLVALGAAVVGLVAVATAYLASGRTVYLQIDGQVLAWRTHHSTAEDVLAELPLTLRPNDAVTLPTAEELLTGRPIQLDLARRVRLAHDGSLTDMETQAETVAGVLDDASLIVGPQDCVALAERCLAADDLLPTPVRAQGLEAMVTAWRSPIDLTVRRARQISILDGGALAQVYTTATTVGEALAQLGLTVYEGDQVYPDLTASIAPDLQISIDRALPVSLLVDGVRRLLRTRASTVQGLLVTEGVVLEGDDYVEPAADEALARGARVTVVRVYDEYYVEEVPIAYETRWEPDPEMEIDLQQVVQWGSEGARRRQVRVHYENGVEQHRSEETEWVAREPADRIIAYGTKIVQRELETPNGTVTYWRKLRMLATSYNAPTAGVSRDASYYGYTRLGWRARFGIVAVDPRVVALGTNVYVPGYGAAAAADTGGGILGRRVDLCYDDDNLVHWYKWVDVYLLTPVPPASDINWIVPNTPKERE